jgi:exopolyphosphatase / guanosine-5'-triphosphate,3'-diphosphate pyrophosphatase
MLRAAAVDLGSNAIRVLIIDVKKTGQASVVLQHRYPLPMGRDVLAHGKITDASIDQLKIVFDSIKRAFEDHSVQRYRAVATAAFRDAANGHLVARQIEKENNIHLEVIDGVEEARLGRSALLRSVGRVPRSTLVFDLGGGSLEFSRAQNEISRSLPMGSRRLLALYAHLEGQVSKREVLLSVKEIGRDFRHFTRARAPAELALATGGNTRSLAKLFGLENCFSPTLSFHGFQANLVRMASEGAFTRAKRYGLRHDRAQTLVADGALLLALAEHFSIRQMVVPATGLRERLGQELCEPGYDAQKFKILSGSGALGVRYKHRLARMCTQVFQATAGSHGLYDVGLNMLWALSYMSDEFRSVEDFYRQPHITERKMQALGFEQASCAILVDVSNASRSIVLASGRKVPRSEDILGALLAISRGLVDCGARDLKAGCTWRRHLELNFSLARRLPSRLVRYLEWALQRPCRIL